MKNNRPLVLKIIVLVLVAFLLGLFFGEFFLRGKQINAGSDIREDNTHSLYTFINPLLFCGISENKDFNEYLSLKEKVTRYVAAAQQDKKVSDVSIYFRDLDSGRWTGINENADYAPASLLKVPTMIAFFALAQSHPDILSQAVYYDGSFDDNAFESIKPLKTIQAHTTYTIDHLIYAMIAYSDNNATRLLHQHIDPALLTEVYTDLGVHVPSSASVDFLSAKSYSYFFRVLYNATYLNRSLSEKALQLLSEPDFPQGITAGVPANITVAQKFGERSIFGPIDHRETGSELHDCGIIYYPKHPYLLCIMTKGYNFTDLTSVIQDISRLTYQDIDMVYK